jgi:hypothetical protein
MDFKTEGKKQKQVRLRKTRILLSQFTTDFFRSTITVFRIPWSFYKKTEIQSIQKEA